MCEGKVLMDIVRQGWNFAGAGVTDIWPGPGVTAGVAFIHLDTCYNLF